MTDTEKRMRSVLTRTGLYTGTDKVFAAETAAYAAGLSLLFDGMEALRRSLFIETADADGLARFERLFRRIPAAGESLQRRREMLLERFSVTMDDNTRAALERLLLAAGIEGNLVEQGESGVYVNVLGLLSVAAETAEREMRAFLPAHLPAVFDFGVNTWNAVDARDMTFLQMDLANRTWNEIDAM